VAFNAMVPGAREGDVYVVDADGDNLTHLAHTRVMDPHTGAATQWSTDGRRVYYNDQEGDTRLAAWVDVDSGERGSYPGGVRTICPTGNRQVYHSLWYPDHALVREKEDRGIFIQDLGTGDSERIVSFADCWRIHPRKDETEDWHLYVSQTKFSPDGSRLMWVFSNAFVYSNKYAELPRVHDLFAANTDGTELRYLGAFGHHPTWHPNGRQLLTNSPYEGRPGNSLVLVDVDTGERRLVTEQISGYGHPSLSPDGKRIVMDFSIGGEGYGSIDLVDVDADTAELLVHVPTTNPTHLGTHMHPVWSRDGKQVMYNNDASGVSELCVVTV
jgi:Tol biopolymer transport system component